MEGTPAFYLGRLVSKDHFRAFIYGSDGRVRLVESWDEFESYMESGLWFASSDEAKGQKEGPKAKPRTKSKRADAKEGVSVEDEVVMAADSMAFEVRDDFLPKG